MKTRLWSMVSLPAGVASSFIFASAPQVKKRLWALRETGKVVEYNASTWAVYKVKVAAEFLRDPDSLQIDRNGRMPFCADPGIQPVNPEHHFPADKVWLWNGRSAAILDRGPGEKTILAAAGVRSRYRASRPARTERRLEHYRAGALQIYGKLRGGVGSSGSTFILEKQQPTCRHGFVFC